MAVVNEQTVSGRKFRKLIDEKTRLWLRISFWTKADDVECDDGETAETKFANIAKKIDDLIKSFQDGVNKIFNYLKGLGFTPSQNSPDGICAAIKNMYDKRYTDGRTQGQNDVIADPDSYGISSEAKAFGLVTGSTQNYACPRAGTYHVQVYYAWFNNHEHNNYGNTVAVNAAGAEYKYIDYHYGNTNWVDDSVYNSGDILTLNLNAGDVISINVSSGSEDIAMTYAAWIVY